jgi:hypothetical protein
MAWLQLTISGMTSKSWVNMDRVIRFEPARGGSYVIVDPKEGNFQVDESTDEILSRLKRAGEECIRSEES